MHPKYLSISDFNYDLPDEKIAEYPLEERSDAKLLIYKNGLSARIFSKTSRSSSCKKFIGI